MPVPEGQRQVLRFASDPGAEWSESKGRQLWPSLLQAPFHRPQPGDPLESKQQDSSRTEQGSLSARLLSAGHSSLV